NGISSAVQNLTQSEPVIPTLRFSDIDDKGGFDDQLVTITINGTNDDPVISGTANNAADLVKEDIDLSATGTLTSADIDNGATATWSIQGSASGTYGSLALRIGRASCRDRLANGP